MGKSQGSGRREELLPRELAVRGSVPSGLLRGPGALERFLDQEAFPHTPTAVNHAKIRRRVCVKRRQRLKFGLASIKVELSHRRDIRLGGEQ